MGLLPAGTILPLGSQKRGAQWRPLGTPHDASKGAGAAIGLVDELEAAGPSFPQRAREHARTQDHVRTQSEEKSQALLGVRT